MIKDDYNNSLNNLKKNNYLKFYKKCKYEDIVITILNNDNNLNITKNYYKNNELLKSKNVKVIYVTGTFYINNDMKLEDYIYDLLINDYILIE